MKKLALVTCTLVLLSITGCKSFSTQTYGVLRLDYHSERPEDFPTTPSKGGKGGKDGKDGLIEKAEILRGFNSRVTALFAKRTVVLKGDDFTQNIAQPRLELPLVAWPGIANIKVRLSPSSSIEFSGGTGRVLKVSSPAPLVLDWEHSVQNRERHPDWLDYIDLEEVFDIFERPTPFSDAFSLYFEAYREPLLMDYLEKVDTERHLNIEKSKLEVYDNLAVATDSERSFIRIYLPFTLRFEGKICSF